MQRRYAESVRRAIARQDESRITVADRIEAALEAGWSLNALATELGCSRETLRVRLARARAGTYRGRAR